MLLEFKVGVELVSPAMLEIAKRTMIEMGSFMLPTLLLANGFVEPKHGSHPDGVGTDVDFLNSSQIA
jgi:hypothetical protein